MKTSFFWQISSNENVDMDWGAVVNYRNTKKDDSQITIDVLLHVDKGIDPATDALIPPSSSGEMKVVTLRLSNITQISSIRLILPKDLRSYDSRQSVLKALNETKRRFKDNIPLLDPLEDMKIKDSDFLNVVKKIESCEKKLKEFKDINSESVKLYEKKAELEEGMNRLRQQMNKTRSLLQMDELKCRKRVLRRLGYCTSADVIEIKGRVACEITRFDYQLVCCGLIDHLFIFLVAMNFCSVKCSSMELSTI